MSTLFILLPLMLFALTSWQASSSTADGMSSSVWPEPSRSAVRSSYTTTASCSVAASGNAERFCERDRQSAMMAASSLRIRLRRFLLKFTCRKDRFELSNFLVRGCNQQQKNSVARIRISITTVPISIPQINVGRPQIDFAAVASIGYIRAVSVTDCWYSPVVVLSSSTSSGPMSYPVGNVFKL
uniref:Uncharacterized protein n=1 Tax=Anopheles atroparvus TaxID=41427 RepID=A0A182IWA2_ANOAO